MAISKILVPITGTLERTDTFALGLSVARLVGAHIEVLYVRMGADHVLATGFQNQTVAWLEANHEAVAAQLATRREGAHQGLLQIALDQARDLASAGTPVGRDALRWRECDGDPAVAVADLGRFADLIVLARADSADTARRKEQIHAALFEARRPVLLTPLDVPPALGRTAIVAWSGSAESMRAITASLPLLARMERVVLLTIGDIDAPDAAREDELLDYLGCHGVVPEWVRHEGPIHGAGPRLLAEAKALGAGLVVMGAYTHSRAHEAILGGATRHVIEETGLPVFLAH
jgi:nucleotide-binding universal stress UspA family protein